MAPAVGLGETGDTEPGGTQALRQETARFVEMVNPVWRPPTAPS